MSANSNVVPFRQPIVNDDEMAVLLMYRDLEPVCKTNIKILIEAALFYGLYDRPTFMDKKKQGAAASPSMPRKRREK